MFTRNIPEVPISTARGHGKRVLISTESISQLWYGIRYNSVVAGTANVLQAQPWLPGLQ